VDSALESALLDELVASIPIAPRDLMDGLASVIPLAPRDLMGSGGGGGGAGGAPGSLSLSTHDFLAAEVIYCSPLTRAVETALLGLHGHPTMAGRGLTLLSTAREKKGLFGRDSQGSVVGMAIGERVHAQLVTTLGEEYTRQVMVNIDPHDCGSVWWVCADTPGALDERFDEFLSTLRDCAESTIIVVGHSLFFQEMVKRHASPQLAHMGDKKLANASCLGMVVDFSQPAAPAIVQAQLMFGTSFADH